MKKMIALTMVFILLCLFSISAFASAEDTYVYNFDSVVVIFDENNSWDAATREAIAHSLVYGEEEPTTTYNLLCNLFGHKYETKSVTTITHCVLDESPRCLEEHFNISLCSRCGDQVTQRTAYCYITCCA